MSTPCGNGREATAPGEWIEGEARKLGHRLAPTTVRNILKASGIEPAPDRRNRTTWRQVLGAHWDCLAVRLPARSPDLPRGDAEEPAESVTCRMRLGGLLRSYERDAA